MTSLHSLQTAINQIFQQTREVTISVYIIYAIIAARWEDVAVQLLSEEHQKEKKANHHDSDDVEKCYSNLFTIWSQRQLEDVTWRALIEAIWNAHFTNEANPAD